MNFAGVIGIVAGILQLGVPVYSLFLWRRFGMGRVGWSIFSSFALLLLLHVMADLDLFRDYFQNPLQLNLLYLVASVLLLISLVHLETLLLERGRAEATVREQTAELTRANAELQHTATQLRAEIAERQRVQAKVDKTHRELMTASRQAGMSEVATAVLHNVGNVLNSVNVSASLVAEHLSAMKVSGVARVAALMNEHAEDIGHFLTQDSKGRRLPEYLSELAKHLSTEQDEILKQVDFVRNRIDHIKEIVSKQQSYGKPTGVVEQARMPEVLDDFLHVHANEFTESGIEILRAYESEAPEITVDRHKVLQILLNLASNARHACLESERPDKRVTVTIEHTDDRVRVSIQDNGIGIAPENLQRIFNHGFTTKKKGGHGFGLHSGSLAAKEMGGSLTAQSAGPGRGAVFTLELPRMAKVRPQVRTNLPSVSKMLVTP
ncbi:MAG: ATP-binding protein [Verrucomicrobiota bacterium]